MTTIAIKDIQRNPNQPRTVFDQVELESLAQSIQGVGLIQPITVEWDGSKYILIDGERRLRACKLAGFTEIECHVKPVLTKKKSTLIEAVVANIQRAAMGPVDEANAYAELIRDLGSADLVADKVGVSVATIYGRLAILELPEVVQQIFNTKNLPIDLTLFARLKRLTLDDQVEVASIGATRSLSAKAIITLCNSKMRGKKANAPKTKRMKEVKVVGSHFDALALVENVKSLRPDDLRAVRATCKACPMYEQASTQICKQCALPGYLNRRTEQKVN